MENIKPKLKHAQFHLTNKCNLDCIFCWCHYNKDKFENISSEKLMIFLKEICDMNPDIITLSGGGEPLVRYELLIKVICFIKKNNPAIKGVLITNGTLFDKKFAEALLYNMWDDIIISLQAADSELNDFIMGKKGAFGNAMGGIRLINRLKKSLKQEKPKLSIKTVLTKYNYKSIFELVKLAKQKNIEKVEFRMVNEENDSDLAVPLSDYQELKKILGRAEKYCEQKHIDIDFEFSLEDLNEKNKNNCDKKNMCKIPLNEIIIFGNGSIGVCCNYFKDQFKKNSKVLIQDDKRSIKDIWLTSFKDMRTFLDEKKYVLCKECSKDMVYLNEHK